jgi:heme exporter protein C
MKNWFYLFVALALVGLAVAPTLILNAPYEASMGLVADIFYFHVPSAIMSFVATFVCAAGSAMYLFKGSEAGDRLAVAAAELTVLFGALELVTGPLWGRKAWGVYWQWDVRLTTALLLWLIFIAYLFARRYGGPGARKLCAGLALFGAADVPLIYGSVRMWRTIHPKTTVVTSLGKTAPGMVAPFWISFVSFLFLFLILLEMRLSLERSRKKLDELHLAVEDLE